MQAATHYHCGYREAAGIQKITPDSGASLVAREWEGLGLIKNKRRTYTS